MLYSYYRISIPSYILYEAIPCPIEYLLKKYGYQDILPIVKPLKLSNILFIFIVPYLISSELIQKLNKDGIFNIEHIKSEEIEHLNLSNKCIGVKHHWEKYYYVSEYFVMTEDYSKISDSDETYTLQDLRFDAFISSLE